MNFIFEFKLLYVEVYRVFTAEFYFGEHASLNGHVSRGFLSLAAVCVSAAENLTYFSELLFSFKMLDAGLMLQLWPLHI